ncbi:hypothetical protein SUGI_1101200 [Cryptomeria japonica]|nr:hypothetical protein SUGI_1101200 [Cryptomeria japonica]
MEGEAKGKGKGSVNVAEIEGHGVHSQVMRIREEDQHLGEDLRERLSPKDRIAILEITSQMKDVFFSCSRPAFPSPLGMKAGVRSA